MTRRATDASSTTARRDFLKVATAGAALGMLQASSPLLAGSQATQGRPLQVGPDGAIPDVPANRAFLAQVDKERELTPEQLLRLGAMFRDHPATTALGARLAFAGMAMLASSPSINRAIATVSKTPIEWSIFGDAWNAVKNFFTGGTGQRDPAHCKYKCVGVLVVSALLEKCGDNDSWHIIGACTGFKW